MQPPIKIYTGITNGLPQDLKALKLAFQHFEGIGVDITIERHKTKRSNRQNNWFHYIVKLITDFERTIAKESGDEKYYRINEERKKLEIKEEFLGYEEMEGERQLIKTRNLTTLQMNELWQNLQIYYAPLGLIIPDPNQQNFLED